MCQQPNLIVDRARLEALLGFPVADPLIYQQAFVHKSAMKTCGEMGLITESYELYEYLGDAVINLVITKFVFDLARAKGQQEGWATKLRTRLVSGQCLSKLAHAMGLQQLVLMNSKAMANGWNCNDRILEDVLEALIGCVYLDTSLSAARAFVLSLVERHIDLDALEVDNNWKDILMRWTQARGRPLPVYKHLEALQDGQKVFITHCFVDGRPMGYGRHRSKKQGEQEAASQALQLLGVAA